MLRAESAIILNMYDTAGASLVLPVRLEININQGSEWEPSDWIPFNKRQEEKKKTLLFLPLLLVIKNN